MLCESKALVIMDIFTGQITTAVFKAFKEAYQPLDLTVNGYCKQFL